MTLLDLRLYDRAKPELSSTLFQHPLVGTLQCVRGKTAGVHAGCGTFHWTNAVKALVVLSVRALHAHLQGLPSPTLQGQGRCLARSLDLAIAKQPLWLTDMFGVTTDGLCFARRLFLRNNPEGRMPGPQSVAFNPATLHPALIRVSIDEEVISSTDLSSALLSALGSDLTHSPDLAGDRAVQGICVTQKYADLT